MLWAMTGVPNGCRFMSGELREYSDCGCVTIPSTWAYQFLQRLELLKPVGTKPVIFKPETAEELVLLAPIRSTIAAMMPKPASLRQSACRSRGDGAPDWKS